MSKNKKTNPNRGSSLDSFLENEGVLETFQAAAIKKVIAFELSQEMEKQAVSKNAMAKQMKTSRSQLDKLLDPDNGNVTIETLQRAATVLGKDIRVELI